MFQIQNISKNFGGIRALQNVSFFIEPKKTTAIIGPNGAGKTTLFDVVSGVVSADEGEIYLDEKNLVSLPPHKVANLGISRTFQQSRLFKNLTILDHLTMCESNDDSKLLKNLLRIKRYELRIKAYKQKLAEFGIEKPLDTLVSKLSYGQRKLLQILMAVLKPHQVLLLDEPVAGVNKLVQGKIESLLLEFKSQGETMIVIDHDMEFIRKLADHVVVMDEGQVLVEGEPEKVLKDKRVLEAYLGE